jgi:GR25 family glycosyltransferase involved in LPS biosynthesis
MECVYINLEGQRERRRSIEGNFAERRAQGWTLSRFEAVDTGFVQAQAVPGTVSAGEKACFLSHRNLIRQHLPSIGPLMVLEDDAMFGGVTCAAIGDTLSKLRETDWDILFTDICVPDVGEWPFFVRQRRLYDRTKALSLLGLAKSHFAGSTSYILNTRSKRLLAEVLSEVQRIDVPYDLYLRTLIQQGRLRAFVIFPFVTSVSKLAERSSIQPSETASLDVVLNWFRRCVWIERDLDQAAVALAQLREAYGSAESAAFASLFEAMLSDTLPKK